jgi:two-component system, chemotaxis family, chemotaxis protein CheY
MKQCLIVDDSDVIRKVTRRLMDRLPFEVSEADSGKSALEHCTKQMPDVILLDWLMPPMSGIEVMDALRDSNAERLPYVIYCTTENDPADINRAFSAGADDYILKPYTRDELAAKLSQAGLI